MRAGAPCLAAYERANGRELMAANCACVAFPAVLIFHRAADWRGLDGVDISHRTTCCCSELQRRPEVSFHEKGLLSPALYCICIDRCAPLFHILRCWSPDVNVPSKDKRWAALINDQRAYVNATVTGGGTCASARLWSSVNVSMPHERTLAYKLCFYTVCSDLLTGCTEQTASPWLCPALHW